MNYNVFNINELLLVFLDNNIIIPVYEIQNNNMGTNGLI